MFIDWPLPLISVGDLKNENDQNPDIEKVRYLLIPNKVVENRVYD